MRRPGSGAFLVRRPHRVTGSHATRFPATPLPLHGESSEPRSRPGRHGRRARCVRGPPVATPTRPASGQPDLEASARRPVSEDRQVHTDAATFTGGPRASERSPAAVAGHPEDGHMAAGEPARSLAAVPPNPGQAVAGSGGWPSTDRGSSPARPRHHAPDPIRGLYPRRRPSQGCIAAACGATSLRPSGSRRPRAIQITAAALHRSGPGAAVLGRFAVLYQRGSPAGPAVTDRGRVPSRCWSVRESSGRASADHTDGPGRPAQRGCAGVPSNRVWHTAVAVDAFMTRPRSS
jgi:hypothetical protein